MLRDLKGLPYSFIPNTSIKQFKRNGIIFSLDKEEKLSIATATVHFYDEI